MLINDYIWRSVLKRPYRLKKIIDVGTGDQVIVLVHGLGAKAKQWQPLVEALDASKYRILAYDLLGFGESPKPGFAKYSVQEHTRSLQSSIGKDISSKQKYMLIGHSMGCIISTNLAYKKPKKINKVILYEPPLLRESKNKIRLRKSFYKYLAGRPALVSGYLKIANMFTDKFSSFAKSSASDVQWLPFERSLRNTIIAQNTIEELEETRVETHIVYGRLDFVVSKIDAKKMAKINPQIKLHYVTEIHDITIKSAKFLKNLIETV